MHHLGTMTRNEGDSINGSAAFDGPGLALMTRPRRSFWVGMQPASLGLISSIRWSWRPGQPPLETG